MAQNNWRFRLKDSLSSVIGIALRCCVALWFLNGTTAAAQNAINQLPAAGDLRPPIRSNLSETESEFIKSPIVEIPQIRPFAKGQARYLQEYQEPNAPGKPFTLYGAVVYAEKNFPKILQAQADVRAARKQVTVQKVKEYNPYSLFSYQQVVATHNKLTQIIFSSPVLPPNPGPGLEGIRMNPQFFSGSGFIIDWAPIDFGLHKARIQESKAGWKVAEANYAVTQLDVSVQTASTFLIAVVMQEQVKAAKANVQRFEDFSRVTHSLVDADLRPAADASLADAQLANAQNDLIRATLQEKLAIAEFANSIGLGGRNISIDAGEIAVVVEPPDLQAMPPTFDSHPFAIQGRANILQDVTHKRVLEKEYYPVFRWLGGMNFRGSSLNIHAAPQSANASGFAPGVPNWNVGLMIDFPFLDIIRIQAEKKVVEERITADRHAYNLILQNLRTQDVQSRARVEAAVQLASNMPVQVAAALKASRQAQARYEAGLGTLAQVAEANQILADSRVKEAVAKVGVWQSLLSVAAVHGDLKPFLNEAARLDLRGK